MQATPIVQEGGIAGLDPTTIARWKAQVADERQRRAPPPEFPTLPDLPAARYADPAFFEQEREALLKRGWTWAAHVDELPDPGCWIVSRRTGAPILIVRGEDRRIRAFYNTCRHRGAPVARGDSGRCAGALTCGYHGWTYCLEGKLRSVTDARDFGALDHDRLGLIPVRCETFASFVFVCEDAGVEPLADFLEPIAKYLRHLALDELKLVHRRAIEVRGNHKVVLENFLEAYHFRLLHQRTTHRIFDHMGTHVHLWRNGHSMMLSPHRREGWVDPGAQGMPEIAGATDIDRDFNASHNIFPNIIFPVSATGVPAVMIWPLAIDRSLMEVMWFAPIGAGERDPRWEARIANFDRIVEEDVSFVPDIQSSIESRGFRGVPLNYQERRIYHWHVELDRRIGAQHVPEAMRVPPLLDAWVED